MRRAVFFLALMAFSGVSDLPGQSAVDVKRPEEHARERKVIERRETQKARSTDLEIRGATAFKEEELRSVLKEEIATIHDFGLTAARADDAAFFLELFYRKHGYAKVDVHYSIEGGSRLVLNVTEGPQAILGTINFVGNNHVPAEKTFRIRGWSDAGALLAIAKGSAVCCGRYTGRRRPAASLLRRRRLSRGDSGCAAISFSRRRCPGRYHDPGA